MGRIITEFTYRSEGVGCILSCYLLLNIDSHHFLFLFSSAVLPLSQPCCKLVSAPVTPWQRKTMREWDGIAMCVSVLKCFHMQCWPVYGRPAVNKQPPLLLSAKRLFSVCWVDISMHIKMCPMRGNKWRIKAFHFHRCIIPIFHSQDTLFLFVLCSGWS